MFTCFDKGTPMYTRIARKGGGIGSTWTIEKPCIVRLFSHVEDKDINADINMDDHAVCRKMLPGQLR